MGKRLLQKAQFLIETSRKRSIRKLLRRHPKLLDQYSFEIAFAARKKSIAMLGFVCGLGVRTSYPGGNLFLNAASSGDVSLIHFLCESGEDITVITADGCTALGYAVAYEEYEAAKAIVDYLGPRLSEIIEGSRDFDQGLIGEIREIGWYGLLEKIESGLQLGR
jgi:hypothetical protein